MIQVYKEILEKKEENYNRQINFLKTEHAAELERLRQSYKKQQQQVEVINLDSSDDSINVEDLQNSMDAYKAQVKEKDKILKDAVTQYTMLEKEINDLKAENLKLHEELDMYRNIVETREKFMDEYDEQEEFEEGNFVLLKKK